VFEFYADGREEFARACVCLPGRACARGRNRTKSVLIAMFNQNFMGLVFHLETELNRSCILRFQTGQHGSCIPCLIRTKSVLLSLIRYNSSAWARACVPACAKNELRIYNLRACVCACAWARSIARACACVLFTRLCACVRSYSNPVGVGIPVHVVRLVSPSGSTT